jgi:hypothetical protein
MKKLTPKVKAFICTMLFGMVLLGFVVSETFLKAFVYVCCAALLIVWLYAVYKILESLFKNLDRQ